jgi:hypothetical protein
MSIEHQQSQRPTNAVLFRVLIPLALVVLATGLALVHARNVSAGLQVIGGAFIATVGGAIAGIAIATFLRGEPKASSRARQESNARATRTQQIPASPLSMDDGLEALPEIDRDRARTAAMYSVRTIGDLAAADEEMQSKLSQVFGHALFKRAHTIAIDCRRMASLDREQVLKHSDNATK